MDAGANAHRAVRRAEQSVFWGAKLMGQVTVRVTLTNARELVMARLGHLAPEAVHACEVEALADTGTLRSVVPPANGCSGTDSSSGFPARAGRLIPTSAFWTSCGSTPAGTLPARCQPRWSCFKHRAISCATSWRVAG